MANLYGLITQAHRTARDKVDGRPVDFVHLKHPVDYRSDNKRTLEITAGFDTDSQRLQRVSITLHDEEIDQTFREGELCDLVSFIGNPFILSFSASNLKESILEPTFDLYKTNYGPISTTKFKSKCEVNNEEVRLRQTEDSSHAIINYDDFGKMFGLNLRGKNQAFNLRLLSDIDTSRIPEAYRWAFVRGFSPTLYLSTKDKKTLYLNGNVNSYNGSFCNSFTLEDGIDSSDARNIVTMAQMTYQQVDAMEEKIRGYRETNLSQMPLKIDRFSVVTDKPEVPNLETALRKGSSVRDKIFNLFKWVSRIPKSESRYEELPIASYRQLPKI